MRRENREGKGRERKDDPNPSRGGFHRLAASAVFPGDAPGEAAQKITSRLSGGGGGEGGEETAAMSRDLRAH